MYTYIQGGETQPEWNAIFLSFLYVNNWSAQIGWPIAFPLNHLWSLSVEEQFYLLWPLALIGLIKVGATRVVACAVLLGVIGTVAVTRAVQFENGSFFGNLYSRTVLRMDALLVGCLAALLWTWGWLPRRGLPVAAWISAGFLGWCVLTLHHSDAILYRGLFTVIAVAGACVILATVEGRWFAVRALDLSPVRALGRVSYGLYLWHVPAFVIVLEHTQDWETAPRVVVGLTAAMAITLVSRFLVERPFLRLKERLEPSRPRHQERLVLSPAELAG